MGENFSFKFTLFTGVLARMVIRSLGIGGPGSPVRRLRLTFTYLDQQNAQYTVKNVHVFVPFFSLRCYYAHFLD